MKSRLFWLTVAPVALYSTATPAAVYMTVEQAQALMFPGVTLTQQFRTLSADQVSAIERDSDVPVHHESLQSWRAPDGGWFIADEVLGKHEFIPIALSLDADGAVTDIEILEYRESYGDGVRDPAWRAQFTGKRHGAALKLEGDIKNISGATLSSKHITDGVRRLLSTYALVLAPSAH
jgi:Na+-translocating ferredoxin:NAD+ oxidoreductase RnfG subunit